MNVKGIVTGIIRDKDTGEVKRTFTAENHVQNWWFKDITDIYGSSGNDVLGPLVFISENNPGAQSRDIKNMSNSVLGTVEPGVTSPVVSYYQPGNYHLKEFQNRFNPPAADKTIYVIGVSPTPTSLSDYQSYGRVDAQAWVYLTSPCTQTTTETLDVFYRIQWYYASDSNLPSFPDDATELSEYESFRLANSFFSSGTYPIGKGGSTGPADDTYRFHYSQKWNPRRTKLFNRQNSYDWLTGTTNTVGLQQPNYYKARHVFNVGLASSIGKVVGTLAFDNAFARKIFENDPNFSPIQNVFGHSSSATQPFYNSGTTQTGTGTMLFDGAGWTNPDYPKLLRIDVTQTGGIGTGEYMIRQRNHFGTNINSYDNLTMQIPAFGSENFHYTDGFRMVRNDIDATVDAYAVNQAASMVRYDNRTVLAAWSNEACIARVDTGIGKRFAADTTPALPATQINSIDVIGTDSWIACRNSGLYKINAAQTTVTTYDTNTTGLTGVTGCYGFGEGFGGRIWAFFGGDIGVAGLYFTDNSGATWTRDSAFTYGVIDANPQLVYNVRCDKSSATHDIAVWYANTLTSVEFKGTIVWYNNTMGGNAVLGPDTGGVYGAVPFWISSGTWTDPDYPITFTNSFSCSPNDGIWATSCQKTAGTSDVARPAVFEFGTTNVNVSTTSFSEATNPFHSGWGVDNLGNDVLFYLSPRFGSTTASYVTLGMLKSDATVELGVTTTSSADNGDFAEQALCYLGGGVFLCMEPPNLSSDYPGEIRIMSAIPSSSPTGDFAEAEVFPLYGWNGSSWEKGNPNGKPFHSGQEALFDGITVAFDDAGGANTFNVTDYYTVGVVDGVWFDGSTTMEHVLDIYTKPTQSHVNAIEASTIPGTTQTPPILYKQVMNIVPNTASDFVDLAGLSLTSTAQIRRNTTSAPETYNAGARSSFPMITNYTPSSPVTIGSHTNVKGFFEWYVLAPPASTYVFQNVVGLSTISQHGEPLDPSTIQYGIKCDSETAAGTDVTVSVLINGTTVYTYPVDWGAYTVGYNDIWFRIIIQTDGNVIFEGSSIINGYAKFYETGAGHAQNADYYADMVFAGQGSYGIQYGSANALRAPGEYLLLGDGVSAGASDPNFAVIDPDFVKITIGGVEALQVGINDDGIALATGEYVVYPNQGTIRYSPADVGKTIVADYTAIVHE